MKFILHTLVDITETGARHNNTNEYKQQQNWMTTINTLGLRTNIEVTNVYQITDSIAKFNFGTSFKGNHKVWVLEFNVERDDALTINMLNSDFNYVPIINLLDETAKLRPNMYTTSDPKFNNILFRKIDKYM
jgi:hypothetical protein